MATLTPGERDAFLAERRVAVIGIGRDGSGPLLSPLWYIHEPPDIVRFCLGASSAKGRRIQAEGRMSFCVQAEDYPYRYVTGEGPVQVRLLGDQTYETILTMASRYLGASGGRAYAEQFSTPDEVEVMLQVERWQAVVPGATEEVAREVGARPAGRLRP